ncbi:thermonuclease family protein [Patescibacteria group bacterium]|nr:thermonuclease family protein [Patescibacteria group bacterium]
MKKNKLLIAIISILIVSTGYYYFTRQGGEIFPTNNLELDKGVVTKVLDGDTIVVVGGYHIRLLGIDADEQDYPCYQAAKERLEELILNKEVILESDQVDRDQYNRSLRYIFLNNQNINVLMVEQGLAIARFYPENVKHKEEIAQAEQRAMAEKRGCKWESIE